MIIFHRCRINQPEHGRSTFTRTSVHFSHPIKAAYADHFLDLNDLNIFLWGLQFLIPPSDTIRSSLRMWYWSTSNSPSWNTCELWAVHISGSPLGCVCFFFGLRPMVFGDFNGCEDVESQSACFKPLQFQFDLTLKPNTWGSAANNWS